MAAWRRAIELSLGDVDVEKSRLIAQSRTEPASRVERARILLGYWKDPSFFAVGQALDCITRRSSAALSGPLLKVRWLRWMIALAPAGSQRSRLKPRLLVYLACRKAKDLGYPHELWTTRLLARHAREHGPAEGHRVSPIWPRARCARSSTRKR